MAKGNDYDASKDVLVHEQKAFEKDAMNITVQIWRYDAGTVKIQIARNRKDRHTGDFMFAKLGRMTWDEFVGVAKTVKEIKERGGIL